LKELIYFNRLLDFISNSINKDIAFPQLRILILVANNQGITQGELAKILRVPKGTVSRNVIKLADLLTQDSKGIWKQRGYGLVEQRPDLDDPRKSACFLTKKGAKVVHDLSKLVTKGASDIGLFKS